MHTDPLRAPTPLPTRATARSTVTAHLTRWGLGAFTGLIPLNPTGIRLSRGLIATVMRLLGPAPAGTTVRAVQEDDVRGEWVLGPGVEPSDAAIYYIHGSAYAICSARTHRGLAARLSAASGLPVFVVDYRLAPENRFPCAADDVAAGFEWLVRQGYPASRIVLGGDSAGGHLACDLVLQRARAGSAQPSSIVLFSPLIDLTFGLARQQERIRRDPAITAAAAARLVALYTRDVPVDHPRLELEFTPAGQLPPFLIQTGGAEMLSADARHLHERLRTHGGDSRLEVWPGMMHVFQALPRLGPEADAALHRVADFLADVDRLHTVSEVS
ncbi:alpha/beta hydrolase [Gordonia hongkongensis]|uniref:Alpha/beta hydrolase n=1 Tax=Gordonia hongkongensis TaxID=1701090 RepID=A0ABT6BUF5_9ACTN|nr:alpha/beta hydrolase [Gordonia hongkongensis]MDF6101227.1 alpha/beta hydrolase [Gordonia hongkongensis]